MILINLVSSQHPAVAPNKQGTSASADCKGRADETIPPRMPKLMIVLLPTSSFRRAIKPFSSARQEIVSTMPIFKAALSFVPNVCIEKFFNHLGVWSINSLPTALSGVTTSSNTAIKVATQTAKKDEIRPATGVVQRGAWSLCLWGADESVSV